MSNKGKMEDTYNLLNTFFVPAVLGCYDFEKDDFLIIQVNEKAKKELNITPPSKNENRFQKILPQIASLIPKEKIRDTIERNSALSTIINFTVKNKKISLTIDILPFYKKNCLLILFKPIKSISSFNTNAELLFQAINISEDAIWILDKDFYVQWANENTKKIFGFPPAQILNKNCFTYVHQTTSPIDECPYLKMKKTLKRESMELRIGKKWAQITVDPIFGEKGEVIGAIHIARDITKQKETEIQLRKHEQALREREEQLWSLINSTEKDIVCFKDGEGRWLLANDADIKLFNLEGVDYYGKTDIELAEFTHPIYRDAFLTCVNSDNLAWESKNVVRSKEIIPTVQGEVSVFDVLKAPLFNPDGSKKGLVIFGRDITELEKANAQLKQSEERFRLIWENSLEGMRLIDKDGIIVDVNDAFCKIMEIDREELIGQFYNKPFIDNRENLVKTYKKRFKTKQIKNRYEVELTLLNGKKKYFELSNSFINSKSGETLLLTVFHDVTESKKLFNDLLTAKEKAEEMNKVKTQFFLYMSHELRTPFMGIIGYANLLLEEIENETHRTMIKRILNSSNRMLETLSTILNITKLEFDQLEYNSNDINVKTILLEIFNRYMESAKAKGIELRKSLKIPDDLSFETDERIIIGILQNLVNNAIKFTNKGYVLISAKISKEKDKNYLLISVKDTGIGIPKSKQKIIWDEFRQVSEGTSREYQGSGLGLTIVKKYCELAGADISLKSKVGKGSEFTVKFLL